MAPLPVYLAFVPIGIVLVALLITGVFFLMGRLTAENVDDIIDALVYISVPLLAVMLFVRFVCLDIRPVEQFDTGSDPIADLWANITAAEKTVCEYITRADTFIQNQVGKPGHDDPSILAAAQQSARTAAGGPLTDCSAGDVAASLDEAENRIQRMETTLNGFTAPVFQQAYKASNTCESFADVSAGAAARITDLQQRVSAIQQLLVLQKKKMLDPIDAKQQALQSGQLSDCDKKRGGAVGANIAGGSPTPAG